MSWIYLCFLFTPTLLDVKECHGFAFVSYSVYIWLVILLARLIPTSKISSTNNMDKYYLYCYEVCLYKTSSLQSLRLSSSLLYIDIINQFYKTLYRYTFCFILEDRRSNYNSFNDVGSHLPNCFWLVDAQRLLCATLSNIIGDKQPSQVLYLLIGKHKKHLYYKDTNKFVRFLDYIFCWFVLKIVIIKKYVS